MRGMVSNSDLVTSDLTGVYTFIRAWAGGARLFVCTVNVVLFQLGRWPTSLVLGVAFLCGSVAGDEKVSILYILRAQ